MRRKKEKPLTCLAYAPVFCTEGREWLDSTLIFPDHSHVEDELARLRVKIPGWYQSNKLVRVAQVQVTEVPHA